MEWEKLMKRNATHLTIGWRETRRKTQKYCIINEKWETINVRLSSDMHAHFCWCYWRLFPILINKKEIPGRMQTQGAEKSWYMIIVVVAASAYLPVPEWNPTHQYPSNKTETKSPPKYFHLVRILRWMLSFFFVVYIQCSSLFSFFFFAAELKFRCLIGLYYTSSFIWISWCWFFPLILCRICHFG